MAKTGDVVFCNTCNGSGLTTVSRVKVDEKGNTTTVQNEEPCKTCNGSGKGGKG